ncbi:MAG TPA: protein translocase subunit SecF [Pyrinomonadaceae bacterium]|nr:protein translocase subunit SecF [Pyrinomonadaceae bacterium]
MVQFFKDVRIDWLANRKGFIAVSILLMLIGLVSAVVRQAVPGGSEAFNMGVDFKGGTVVTVKFKQRPSPEAVHAAVSAQGIRDAVIQPDTSKPDEMLVKIPRQDNGQQQQTSAPPQTNNQPAQSNSQPQQPNPQPGGTGQTQAQVDVGRVKVRQALNTFGPEAQEGKELRDDPNAAYKIVGTDAVGAIAGAQLRNQAIAVTLAALVGILMYIAFRFEWTYGAAAVIAVFHDVLVTLGFFSLFQLEINLTVIAALLTLVGFSVNDTIVVFDRIRENLRLHRRDSLYKVTNDSINQTLSRTVITSGLVFLSVLALVLFGGEVLRGFSLALLIGIVFGTYSSVAIASPIMVWWQQRLDTSGRVSAPPAKEGGQTANRASRQRSRAQASGVAS